MLFDGLGGQDESVKNNKNGLLFQLYERNFWPHIIKIQIKLSWTIYIMPSHFQFENKFISWQKIL